MASEPLRIGVLGAARITPLSLAGPAAATGHRLVAVAAPDAVRAVDVEFPSGATGFGGSDMDSFERDMALTVRGTTGELVVPMFPVPHEGDSLVLRRPGLADVVEHLGTRTSYTYQLEAFAAAVRDGAPVVTNADWSVATMELVDAAYLASGLRPSLA